MKVEQGMIVEFFPSDRTRKKFEKDNQDSYAAIVTDVNPKSVDLGVLEKGYVPAEGIAHRDAAKEGASYWDFFERTKLKGKFWAALGQPTESVVPPTNEG